MKRGVVVAVFLLGFIFPPQVEHSSATARLEGPAERAVLPAVFALEAFKSDLHGQVEDQGVLIETADGRYTLASENADRLFNPASVMKLATSLTALSKFGPYYRYRTDVLADGQIDHLSRKLEGNLVIKASADPMFGLADAQELAGQLAEMGIAQVTGSLLFDGPFFYFATGYHSNLSPETSAAKLNEALKRAGIIVQGPTAFGSANGKALLSHYSDRLINILLYQNSLSSNMVAEVVGESVGGPEAIQKFLTQDVGLSEGDLHVGRASGLGFNRITPRASLMVLRSLMALLSRYALKPEDVMPVAGIDSGTLRSRLDENGVRGSVIAKTGTLVSFDNGVSTLVGITMTRSQGPLLFAIFNTAGDVHTYRRLQDRFLLRVIEDNGGGLPTSRVEDWMASSGRSAFVRIFSPSS